MDSTFYKEDIIKKKLCNFILNSNKLSMGKKCLEFESKFSKYQGRTFSVFYNSGSSANLALIQSLINLGKLKKGDAVGFSAVTWATNVMPLIQLGLKPVPIDISLDNLNVDSNTLLSVLKNEDLKVVFITNLLGFCADIDKISEICDEKGILLLEDNCESLGSEFKGTKLGNWGLASTFSFFVGHHMSTIEGGMVSTNDEDLYDMLVMVRAHGWDRNLEKRKQKKLRGKYGIDDFYSKYSFYSLSYNLRPTEINGFIGLEQLDYLDEVNNLRNKNYLEFDKIAKSNSDFIELNLEHMSFISNFVYPVICKNKEVLERYKEKFFGSKVEIRPLAGGSILDQPFFKEYLLKNNLTYSCLNSKKVSDSSFYFPNRPGLSKEEKRLLSTLLEGI